MAKLHEMITSLNSLLAIERYSDFGFNGLQVESNTNNEINRVALAVDAGLSVVEQAISQGAQLLIVHHGIFWGAQEPIVGSLANKLKLLLTHNCSLYAAHLPLDGNIDVGNAAEFARFLKFDSIAPAFVHNGQTIGITATTAELMLDDIVKRCDCLLGKSPIVKLGFGAKQIKRIGIVTGSGTSAILEAKELGLDLLISGEPQQKAYHLAKELQINVLFVGHYASETFGVIALGKVLERNFGLEAFFIDQPTGI